jgi:hypothetical protein
MINNTILVLAILIALVPFFGISHAAKEGISVFFALLIIILSILSEQRLALLVGKKKNAEVEENIPPVGVPLNNYNDR